MRDISIIVYDEYVDDVVDSLHKAGVAEISNIERDKNIIDEIEEERIPDIIKNFTDYDLKLSSILDVFDSIEEEKSLKETIFPAEEKKIFRKEKNPETLFEEIDELFDNNGKDILSLNKKINGIDDRVNELKTRREELDYINKIDIELDDIGESEYLVIRAGKTTSPDKLKKALSEIKATFCHLEKIDEGYAVIAGAYKKDYTEFERALRRGEVRVFNLEGLKGKPYEALDRTISKIEILNKKKSKLENKLKKAKHKWQKRYLVLKEELQIYRERKEIKQKFGGTKSTKIIKGWAPKSNIDEVKKIAENNSEGCSFVSSKKPENDDEVPTLLDNPSFIKPFELLTNMFSIPNYDEVDPTFILAPAFVLFFGLMLGDLIYGTIIIATSIVLIKGMGKVDKGTRDFGWILFSCGISTVIFGAIQGGYMGPARESYPNFLGLMGIGTPSILDTLEGEGPLNLLIISLIIGLVYINIGLVLSLVQHLHRGNYKNILLGNLSWWTLQPGGFILISGGLFGWYDFSQNVNYIAWGLVGIGLILLVIHNKGLSFFEITGFIGDFLSFARILALGLATAGIALTVNVLMDLISKGNLGSLIPLAIFATGALLSIYGIFKSNKKLMSLGILIVLFGSLGFINPKYPIYLMTMAIFIIGHIMNLGLQALGSFVHALRLQYVEFFGYFYEGGGSAFDPFKPKRVYTISKDEVVE